MDIDADEFERLFDKAVEIVKEKGQARVSDLQLGLRINLWQALHLTDVLRDMRYIDKQNRYTPMAAKAYEDEFVERGMVVVRRLLAEHAPAASPPTAADGE